MGRGTVFEISARTNKETIWYRFKGGRDGAGPEGELFMDSTGNLYGTTFGGGSNCQKRVELALAVAPSLDRAQFLVAAELTLDLRDGEIVEKPLRASLEESV